MQAVALFGPFSWPHLCTRNCLTILVAPCTLAPSVSASSIIHCVVTSWASDWKYFGNWSVMLIWNCKNSIEMLCCEWMLPVIGVCVLLNLRVRPFDRMWHQSIFDMARENRSYFYKNLMFFALSYNERFSFCTVFFSKWQRSIQHCPLNVYTCAVWVYGRFWHFRFIVCVVVCAVRMAINVCSVDCVDKVWWICTVLNWAQCRRSIRANFSLIYYKCCD